MNDFFQIVSISLLNHMIFLLYITCYDIRGDMISRTYFQMNDRRSILTYNLPEKQHSVKRSHHFYLKTSSSIKLFK